jgi:hypothetical protein
VRSRHYVLVRPRNPRGEARSAAWNDLLEIMIVLAILAVVMGLLIGPEISTVLEVID